VPPHPGQPAGARTRYRFGDFVVSRARRQLLKNGCEVPLIPRYLDLLLLLIQRRHEAVHRREIFERVWSDVVVSDGALSQAVRTLRRALGDDPREPRFLRTVSRHGYQFVHLEVREEADEGPMSTAQPESAAANGAGSASSSDPMEAAIERLLADGPLVDDDDRREAAEVLHTLGTEEALRRLDRRPGHERARALLRDSRWDVPGAGAVPLLGQPNTLATMRALVALRLRRAVRLAGSRWGAASGGGAAAGLVAGGVGGTVLSFSPGADVPASVVVALGLVGAVVGGLGAAGVGAGLAAAEALVRSFRSLALVVFGGLGGAAIGAVASRLGRWTLEGIFGRDLPAVGGGFEGLVIGAAAGLGYALSTPRPGGGMATPRGLERLRAAFVTAACCAAAAVALSLLGGHLGSDSLDAMARSFHGSRVVLTPLCRLFGEEDMGPVTRSVLGVYEGVLFGLGLTLGLTRRPRRAAS
jgi:DNA-binding winged helix-turn-helix (wHTH) protein